MPGSGHRGRTASSWHGDPGDQLQARRAGAPGQVGEVAGPALGVANAQPGQPALDQLAGSRDRLRNQSVLVSEMSGMPQPLERESIALQDGSIGSSRPAKPGPTCWRWRKIISTSPRLRPRRAAIIALVGAGAARAGPVGERGGGGRARAGRRVAAMRRPRIAEVDEARVEPVFAAPLAQQLEEPFLEAARDDPRAGCREASSPEVKIGKPPPGRR